MATVEARLREEDVMKTKLGIGAVALAAYAAVAGCSKSEKPSDNQAAAGMASSGAGGSSSGASGSAGAGGSAGKPNNGPAITSAPPAWVRPEDCKGIGNLCPNLSGCSTGSTCQLEGNVCIPAFAPGATSLPAKSMDHPYCAAYTCMTFEEASCFCTGEAGKKEARCSSPAALAGLCNGKGGSCSAEKACCDGLTCVDRGGSSVCEQPCQTAADCATGCCTDRWDTGVTICAAETACTNPCKKRGEACTQGDSTTPSNCCRGACVDSEVSDWAGCRPRCNTDAECDTGCCQPFSNGGGFCVDAAYCTCLTVDTPCGADAKSKCCEGTTCAGKDPDFTCRKLCTQPSDCATGCCRPLSDNSKSICSPAEQCP
jgi:hypothetical protein